MFGCLSCLGHVWGEYHGSHQLHLLGGVLAFACRDPFADLSIAKLSGIPDHCNKPFKTTALHKVTVKRKERFLILTFSGICQMLVSGMMKNLHNLDDFILNSVRTEEEPACNGHEKRRREGQKYSNCEETTQQLLS
ncbi:hypothetical protein BLNAU_13005 [Blattamonas nauphoetae]|uniref:Uncharacterized protein n=1 Tax=Blattamonas nauphoetae TaxID=2049346 RepID=A0ABQ9XL04_9EUKA|nr:hypothetical protein BLNAU_13005 [Blattamonas nauphoetae]